MKSLLLFSLLGGLAWGQTHATLFSDYPVTCAEGQRQTTRMVNNCYKDFQQCSLITMWGCEDKPRSKRVTAPITRITDSYCNSLPIRTRKFPRLPLVKPRRPEVCAGCMVREVATRDWGTTLHGGGYPIKDEPPIQERYLAHHAGESADCGYNACVYSIDDYQYRPVCADKRRFMLTAGDGTKHCIKF